MSTLNKLKSIELKQRPCLFVMHPLVEETEEFRLQYLAAITLGIAVDRSPKDTERQAYYALATALKIEQSEADEQLDERASMSENDAAALIKLVQHKNVEATYLLDLAWIQLVDEKVDDAELQAFQTLAALLKISSEVLDTLYCFVMAVRNGDIPQTLENFNNLPKNSRLMEIASTLDIVQLALDTPTNKTGNDSMLSRANALLQMLDSAATENDVESSLTDTSDNTDAVAENPTDSVVAKKRSPLDSFICDVSSQINDKKNFYCDWDVVVPYTKREKKISNAIKSYAHRDRDISRDNDDKIMNADAPVLFIDITLFGSGSDGFYVTDKVLYAKPFLEDRYTIKLKDITSIVLNDSEQEIVINDSDHLSYTHSELTPRMRVVIDCISAYISQ